MGIIFARRQEERNEFKQSRERAVESLSRFKPDYVDNDELVGLALEGDHTVPDIEGSLALEDPDNASDDEDGPEEQEEVQDEQPDGPRQRAEKRIRHENHKLLLAAAQGRSWKVLQLGRNGHVWIDFADSHGRTALFFAAQNGHAAAIDTLLGYRARVMKATNDGWTPLHAAVFHGQISCMEALILEKSDVNARDKFGCTPLIFAASSPKLHLLDFVSKSDRKRRKKARLEASTQKKELRRNGNLMQDPMTLWMQGPDRIELIVMEQLLSYPATILEAADDNRRTPLIYAARYGHLHAVSRLLFAKADFRGADREGRTPLFHAACNGHVEVVDFLLQVGGVVNTQDQQYMTPLHAAMENNDEAMANLLLKAQASVQAYDCKGQTPIMLAMDQANRRLFANLVEQGCSLDVLDKRGWNVVIYAIEKGMLDEVMPIMMKLGDHCKTIIRARDPQGSNAVHHAAKLTSQSLAHDYINRLLQLDHEAAALGDCNGNTAFHMLAELGRTEELRMLISYMPAADFLNNRDETPLHPAARAGHIACVVALVSSNTATGAPACNAAAIDAAGWTVLMHACVSGHLDLVNMLLQNRDGLHPELSLPPLDINHRDGAGVSALTIAAREGHWQLLPSLVLAGANCQAKDNDGCTALHWAVLEDEPAVVNTLLDLGFDANAIDARGWTPLMYGSANSSNLGLRVLLDRQADVEARNWDGDTALQLCLRCDGDSHKIAATKDLLVDAMLDLDCAPSFPVAAFGHFMVSVIDAEDLYLEGHMGEVNAYVCLQLRLEDHTVPQVAFSSCTLRAPRPEWHESFRFNSERLESSACLVAWVISAPGGTPAEIMEGAERGLDEAELRQVKAEQIALGQPTQSAKLDLASSLRQSSRRLRRRAEVVESLEVNKLRQLATVEVHETVPTSDLLVLNANQRDRVPFEERRWNEVVNLKKQLKSTGCDIDDPPVPWTHLPLGCVVGRFRHLRAAVWGTEPVELYRSLRLNCRGSLRLEIDFRPRFFVAEIGRLITKEDGIYEPRRCSADEEETALLEGVWSAQDRKQEKENEKEQQQRLDMSLDERMAAASGGKVRSDPEAMLRRFMAVAVWSSKVLRARRRLGAGKPHDLVPNSNASTSETWRSFVTSKVLKLTRTLHQGDEKHIARRQMMDRPIGASLSLQQLSQEGHDQEELHKRKAAKEQHEKLKLPRLKAEPWLEELVESSRLL